MELAADGFFPSDMIIILPPSTTSLVDVALLLCFLVLVPLSQSQ